MVTLNILINLDRGLELKILKLEKYTLAIGEVIRTGTSSSLAF